jgi:hypothetical protein
MISWQSRKQSSIALNTTKAEYIVACSANCEAIWLRKLLTDLFDLEMRATLILCDNQSCIKMTENLVFHDKSKHIEIRYHYIRDMVQRGALKLCYPRYLGITRRSCLEAHMVLDMEYREQERPEHGPGGPFFFFSARFVLPAVPASITTGLGLYQKGLLLHEVIGLRYHGMCHI